MTLLPRPTAMPLSLTLSLPRRLLRLALALCALAVLTGCAALSAVNKVAVPLEVYELRPPAGLAQAAARPRPLDVIVELPTTAGSLDTDRIMIRPNALQAQYLPEVRWADPVPVMVQTLMLRSLEAGGALRYVGRKPLGASGDYALVTEVVDFQAALAPDGATAGVTLGLIVRLVRERDARIVASRSFRAEAPAASTETAALIAAFDAAAAAVLTEFAGWLPGALPG